MTDGGFKPEPLAPVMSQHTTVPRAKVKGNSVQHKTNLMLDTTTFHLEGRGSKVVGPVLQTRSSPGAVPDHMTDWSFGPEHLASVASQHTAVPTTWVVQRYAVIKRYAEALPVR